MSATVAGLAQKVRELGGTPAEVTTGEHAGVQSQMASLGYELAGRVLDAVAPAVGTRMALVGSDAAAVAAYLPANYEVVAEVRGACVIAGEDTAGWTLDGYVLPRLASGMHTGCEIRVADVSADPTGLRTAPGVHHADMRPTVRARCAAQAGVGRALAAYGIAQQLYGHGEVTERNVTRRITEYRAALDKLVRAAQAEGADA